jgi:WD40 repeat protein
MMHSLDFLTKLPRRLLWEGLGLGGLLLAGLCWLWLDPPPNRDSRPASQGDRVRRRAELEGPPRAPASIAFSPDGKLALAADLTNSVHLWDVASGQLLRTLEAGYPEWTRTQVSFSADGRLALAAWTPGNQCKSWRVSDGRPELAFQFHSQGWVFAHAFSADGRRLVVGGIEADLDDPQVTWTVEHGQVVMRRPRRGLPDHLENVGYFILSKDSDGTYRLLDLRAGKQLRARGTLEIWDTTQGRLLRTLFREPQISVRAVALSSDGGLALAVKRRGEVEELELWDTVTGKKLRALAEQEQYVTSVAFSPITNKVLAAVAGSLPGDSEEVREFPGQHPGPRLKCWDAGTGKLIAVYERSESLYPIQAIAVAPDENLAVTASGILGRQVLSSADLGELNVWELASGRTRRFDNGLDSLMAVAFAPGGEQVLAATGRELHLWDLQRGKLIRKLSGPSLQQ